MMPERGRNEEGGWAKVGVFPLQFDTLLQYTRIVSMVEKTTSTLPEQT